MDATKRKRLYELPEYRVLDAKRKKLVSFHVLDGVAFSRACTMLNLNKTREAKRPDVKTCLAAFNRAQDPDGQGQLYETVRRLEILWYGIPSTPDENFATVNLPLSTPGLFITPEGKTVDAAGLPIPAPPKPDLSTRPCDVCGANYPHGTICPPCQFKAAGREYAAPLP
jgi:hypothetical protein